MSEETPLERWATGMSQAKILRLDTRTAQDLAAIAERVNREVAAIKADRDAWRKMAQKLAVCTKHLSGAEPGDAETAKRFAVLFLADFEAMNQPEQGRGEGP